jgi:hypothetical protein
MDKVAIFFDLLSGFLVTIDVAAPSWGQKTGSWLMRQLPGSDDTVNPLRPRTFLVNLFLTLLLLSILIFFAIAKDTSAGTTFSWSTVVLFYLGICVGVIIISMLSLAVFWLRRRYTRRHGTTKFVLDKPVFSSPTSAQDATLLAVIWSIFLILGALALFLLRFATGTRVFLAGPILTFVLTLWVLPTAMLSNRSFVNYVTANPEKPHYALARIGLLIFVISKIVYLKI